MIKLRIDFRRTAENLQDLLTISFIIFFITFIVESDGGDVKLGEKSFELGLLSLILLLVCMIAKRLTTKKIKNEEVNMIDSKKMKNFMENFEDLFLVLDIILTTVAVVAGNFGNSNLSSTFFGSSGGSLVLSLMFMIIKRIKNR